MPTHDFQCGKCDAVSTLIVRWEETGEWKTQPCTECNAPATLIFRQAPKIDWMGIGAQENASPEFIRKFEKAHKERRQQEEAHTKEHGDSMRGAGG